MFVCVCVERWNNPLLRVNFALRIRKTNWLGLKLQRSTTVCHHKGVVVCAAHCGSMHVLLYIFTVYRRSGEKAIKQREVESRREREGGTKHGRRDKKKMLHCNDDHGRRGYLTRIDCQITENRVSHKLNSQQRMLPQECNVTLAVRALRMSLFYLPFFCGTFLIRFVRALTFWFWMWCGRRINCARTNANVVDSSLWCDTSLIRQMINVHGKCVPLQEERNRAERAGKTGKSDGDGGGWRECANETADGFVHIDEKSFDGFWCELILSSS